MKSLRDTPVRSQPDPVAEHSICERVQTSAKVEQAEELELQCVGTSSPLKSKWEVYLLPLSQALVERVGEHKFTVEHVLMSPIHSISDLVY